jgi:GT2 family glycosyltransferase
MLVKRQVLELVGLLDGRLFFGAEDADFCLRAREQGFQMYYAPQVTVYHKVARTYDRYDPQMLQHMYSGKILFVKKHSSRWGWRLWRVAFLCYMLLIGIPRLSLMSYRSTGHARIVPIAQRLLAAYREHALM